MRCACVHDQQQQQDQQHSAAVVGLLESTGAWAVAVVCWVVFGPGLSDKRLPLKILWLSFLIYDQFRITRSLLLPKMRIDLHRLGLSTSYRMGCSSSESCTPFPKILYTWRIMGLSK